MAVKKCPVLLVFLAAVLAVTAEDVSLTPPDLELHLSDPVLPDPALTPSPSNASTTDPADSSTPDDIPEDSAPDACTEAMTTLCSLGDHYTFAESLRCLESHVTELQGACSVALNVMMTNLYTDCGDAVSSLCPSTTSASSDESVYVLMCLSNHESELSADCQQQLDTYLKEEYPCTKEAALFCSESSSATPEKTLSCLETIAATSPDEVSLQCAAVLDGFSSCKEHGDGGPGGEEGKPKPKPRARSRLLTSSSAESVAESESVTAASKEDKPKPKPKPKPAPGGGEADRRCWRGSGSSLGGQGRAEGEGGGGFLDGGLSGLYGGSGPEDESTKEESHTTGMVMGSLVVVLALVGMLGVRYRRSQEERDARGGYWRAPSIQAMLYDDSSHSQSGLTDSYDESINKAGCAGRGGEGVRVVEMNDARSLQPPLAEVVQVTLSPIASDEIRV